MRVWVCFQQGTVRPSIGEQRIEQRHQRYQEVREIIARSPKGNTRSGSTEMCRREIERLDTQIASILAMMTERAQKDTIELNAMI